MSLRSPRPRAALLLPLPIVFALAIGGGCGDDSTGAEAGASAAGAAGTALSGGNGGAAGGAGALGLGPLPAVDELPENAALPDLFASFRGDRTAQTPEDFRTWRADELRGLFSHYVYGVSPPAPPAGTVTAELVASADDLLDGTVTYEEYAVRFGPKAEAVLYLSVFAPKGKAKPPVFLGPNKCGNQSVTLDPRVRATSSYLHLDCGKSAEGARGLHATYFPLADITAAGFALATFHESDAAPDLVENVDNGIRQHVAPDAPAATKWGAIATWSWAISRAIDFLDPSGLVDPEKVAVVGHSRRGKAALWAAANDPRIDLVVAHQSGTAGAALNRSLSGESIQAINTFFPHWFDDVFPTFAKNELRTPVDQHQLLALIAPRPLLVTDGDGDAHADPQGARAAVEAADPAWKLFGDAGIVPGPDGLPSREGRLVWTTRPGEHSIGPVDWAIFLPFARKHFGL